MDRDATDVVSTHFAFAGMQAASDVNTHFGHAVGDGERAANGTSRPLERREESVTGVFDLSPGRWLSSSRRTSWS